MATQKSIRFGDSREFTFLALEILATNFWIEDTNITMMITL